MINQTISKETILKTGIIFALLTVAIGAFGAHGLFEILSENDKLETYKTAVLYQLFHSIAVIVGGLLCDIYNPDKLKIAFVFHVAGILLFSGSLYLLAITNIGLFGAITPIGGVLFIVGWIYLFLSIKSKK